MKKFISIMLCVCICLSSTVFCFADFTATDSTTLSNIYKYMPTASQVTTLNNTLSTISTRVLNIYNALFDGNHSVAYWVHAIDSFMNPIYTAIQNTPTELESIKRLLGYVSYENETEVIDPYLAYNTKGVARWASDIYDLDFIIANRLQKGSYPTYYQNNPDIPLTFNSYDGSYFQASITPRSTDVLGAIFYALRNMNNSLVKYDADFMSRGLTGYNSTQTYTLWTGDSLTTSTFTPSSLTSGLYNWLSNIQTPVARLSYVLASDERIEAQEKAAANEEAVVDNFIDSSGSGAASPSDIGSVSDLSSGFKNNIATDASVSGIWNIFNSDNFGWFSQETADQLDTSGSGNRTLRSSGNYSTPLLDQQTEDILKYIGGDDND